MSVAFRSTADSILGAIGSAPTCSRYVVIYWAKKSLSDGVTWGSTGYMEIVLSYSVANNTGL